VKGSEPPPIMRPKQPATLLALDAQFDQIRSRDRVRDLAEVFTHPREVHAMLDLIPNAFADVDGKFLEPACGSGNFLVEILRRKLVHVVYAATGTQANYEHMLLRAVASIYGVDISLENVAESRARMAHILLTHYQSDAGSVEPTAEFVAAAGLILDANIVVGDTLKDAATLELCDWQPHAGERFRRVWSYALVPESQRNVFWTEREQDHTPVHYSQLTTTSSESGGQ
jgi:SAM-dependent methyltransferase